MKVKIVINTMTIDNEAEVSTKRWSEVWSGEMDILEEGEYLTKISLIAEGQAHPICDVPFSIMEGYWQWVPPLTDDEDLEEIEQKIIENTEGLSCAHSGYYGAVSGRYSGC